jgi:Flp pilus assembly protein TadB
VALAREELKAELTQAKAAGISIGAAAAFALAGLTMCCVAIAAAFANVGIAALVVAGVLLLVAGLLGYLGYRAVPRKPFGETRARLGSDVKQLRERIA